MTHLTMDQLIVLREPGVEPGTQAMYEHLDLCAVCQAERDRLDQRIARLRALPSLRPARSRFKAVRNQLIADQRRRIFRAAALGGLALAASLSAIALIGPALGRGAAVPTPYTVSRSEIQTAIAQSQQLEGMLQSLAPERRALNGRTANLAARLEDQISGLDRQLQAANGLTPALRGREQLRLWRERTGLLNALMDVHLTEARFAGL